MLDMKNGCIVKTFLTRLDFTGYNLGRDEISIRVTIESKDDNESNYWYFEGLSLRLLKKKNRCNVLQ